MALDEALGDLCETKDADDEILAYVSTASVARDIVEIAERVEEHRQGGNAAPQGSVQYPMRTGRKQPEKKPARVLYWGFSYGTILGNTLASLFPGHIARVVLDGVVDTDDYYGGTWERNLLDTDKIVDYFYETCFDGSSACPLWKEDDNSGEDIKKRIDKLISNSDSSPISLVRSDGSFNLGVITGNDIRYTFRE